MKLILSIISGFLIAISQPLLAQTMSVVANLQESGGGDQVGPATFSFYEREFKTIQYPIFDSYTFTPSEAGHVFTVTQANDSNFDPLAALLTDGVDEDVGYAFRINGGPGVQLNAPESVFFGNMPNNNPNGFGLKGFKIDSISLVFNQLSLDSPGSNPNGDGIWTDFSFNAELSINYEPVPEPALPSLIVVGLLFGVLFRRLSALTNPDKPTDDIKVP
jgi:hypothetical protein